MSGGGDRLVVALDATPLLGVRTGVGAFCAGALEAVGSRPDLDVAAFAVSWRRRRGIVGQLPPGVRAVDAAMPARPVHLAWRALGSPAIEWWTGRLDVVHGTNFVVPPTRRAAQVVTVHDLTTVRFPEMASGTTAQFPALVCRALDRGAWVHTPSAFVANEVVELLGADPERVRTIHHGISQHGVSTHTQAGWSARAPAGASHQAAGADPDLVGLRVKRPYLLALGTVEPRKDLGSLVRAFDALASTHRDLCLVVAGPDGWGTAAFEAAVAAAAHRERVIRVGYVDPATRDLLLAGAAVFAYPSRYEGFGFPPLEAMAAGVPVVTTTAGALPEVVGDGAELVEVGDSQGLAAAIDRLLSDEVARTALVARGTHRVRTFSWETCGAGLAQLYWDAAGVRVAA